MRAIGIDPGTREVGYGVVDSLDGKLCYRDSGTIACPGEKDLARRLAAIHRALQVVMREWAPEAAAVEKVFFGRDSQAAIKIGEGRGVALLSAAEAGVPVTGYEPTLVKRALCGNGRAGKSQVQKTVRALLSLEKLPPSDHESDALALAICHLYRDRAPCPQQGPKTLPAAVLKALGGRLPARRRKKARRMRLGRSLRKEL
ncbi:MAG: crossover junction endodeoxyribonuclease RuvC [Planctomycetota bacterium]